MIIAACETIKSIKESFKENTEELWLQLHVGDSVRCKIDIHDKDELKFVTNIMDKLGKYLGEYLLDTIQTLRS